MLVKRPRLREGGFKPYLFKTARNLALRHLSLLCLVMSYHGLFNLLVAAGGAAGISAVVLPIASLALVVLVQRRQRRQRQQTSDESDNGA